MASSGLHGLQWPQIFSQFWPQKHAHENRCVKRASHVKYEPFTPSGTPSNRLFNGKMASNGLKNSLEPPRGQIWHPEVRASHLSIIYGGLGGSRSLEQPRAASDLKSGRMASRLDPHIWYSNDLPWPQDVKFDLDLGWPRRPRVTSEVQNRGRGQIWHPKVIWVESWVVLTWYFWGKPKILFSPNLSPTV